MVLVGHLVDVAFVGSGSETYFSQNVIDVGFPEGASFGVALKGVADGEDKGAIELDTVAFEVPFGVGVIDDDVGRDTGGGGVSVGIAGVGSEDLHVEGCREGHEQAHARVLDAGRVGAGETMEFRGSALGAITAVAGTTGAIRLNLVHPMLAKDNSTGGTRAGFTVHGEVGKAIELLEFGTFPEGPGV